MITGPLSEKEKEIIKQLRNEHKSYGEIANVLNCKLDRVKDYCKRNGLVGWSGRNLVDDSVNIFIENLNKNHGNKFEYVSDYVHSDSLVKVKCKVCNQVSEKNAAFARKNKDSICIHCEHAKSERNKKDREIQQLRRTILRAAEKRTRAVKEITINRCKECSKVYAGNGKYCSVKCMKKVNNRRKELRRRKLKDSSITLSDVVKKEKNICYLCNEECNDQDYTMNDKKHFIVGKSYPSIEHVQPISKGGKHTWDNIRLAHHYCNTIKRDKVLN